MKIPLTKKSSRKIKVYFQKSFGVSDSAYYKYLRDYPPKDIEYVGGKKFKIITNNKNLKRVFWLKQFARNIIKVFNISIPNAYHTKNANKYDLIHCTNCLSKNKQPWVADMEFIRFQMGSYSKINNPILKKLIRTYVNSSYCKKIMAWSEWSKKGILEQFPELKNKIEIIYPAVPLHKFKKKEDNKIKILFVGREFKIKGGDIALGIMDKLTKKYPNVEGIVVSDVPPEIIKKYSVNKKINFLGLVSQERLFNEIYPQSDIFLYPTFSDTFGFAIIEAQSFGLPVVAMKTKSTHTITETIQERKTGFIIENLSADAINRIIPQKVLNKMTKKIEGLILDRKILKIMSKNCTNEIKNGRFSIKGRNKKLGKIYLDAIL